MIRVGRRKYVSGKYRDPSFPNFTKILCLTKSTPYGDLGPYVLQNSKGQLMENIWQASKVYKVVPKTRCCKSRYDRTVIWDHPVETHVNEDGKLTPEYYQWREKLMNNKEPVRYPVGFKYRHQCLYAFSKDPSEKLDYISARKKIYVPVYADMVKSKQKFQYLKSRLAKGENLLIIEVDGPHQESIDYYKEKYNVSNNFIENDTILINKENMTIMLNDTKHPYGHGYCLATTLLDLNLNLE